MKYLKSGIILFLLFSFQAVGQVKYAKFINPKIVGVCYGDKKIANTYIPPPHMFSETQAKGGEKKSNIIVHYIGFTPEAKQAFQYAVDIWESILSSDVPIYMEARWSDLGTNVLGNCYSNGYYLGLAVGAPMPYAYYPVAIAEKINRKEISDSTDPDLIANFSNSAPWYYGTDDQTPSNKYSLASVALHEICHGIGFIGSMGITTSNQGVYGFSNGYTNVFDHYLENQAGNRLTDTSVFKNPSTALYNVFTSGLLYYSSPVELINNNQNRARMYAPLTFNEGSSIYHLNEGTYPSGNENSLMTPFSSFAETIFNPGPITLGMAADWGWVHTWIDHDPLRDRESLSDTSKVKVNITSDTEFYADSSYLVYSTDEFSTVDSILFSAGDSVGEFETIIPVNSLDQTISYYITTIDTFGRVFTNPPGAPDLYFHYYVGPDTIKPEITHFPVEFIIYSAETLPIRAAVSDNIGIDSVYVEYFINETAQPTVRLSLDSVINYSGILSFQPGILTPGDSIRYRIVAVDSSQNANLAFSPDSAYYVIKVEDIRAPQNEYQNDFETTTSDFLMTGFSILKVKGFDDNSLNTKHPYESPDQDNQHLEYFAQLKIPIILKADDSYMRFDEIVLVEPGETGTSWGDDEFWDYVIIEGSKDDGKTWQNFQEGYDCKKYSTWLSRYNSSISNGNSTAVGSPDLYKSSMVNLLANSNFNGGDTVLIRFRLYSDPYAHGWGWSIDNLEIQGAVSSVKEPFNQAGDLKIYPNPLRNIFTVELKNLPSSVHEVSVVITDITGRRILTLNEASYINGMKKTLDISNQPDGLYFVEIKAGNFRKVVKLVKTK